MTVTFKSVCIYRNAVETALTKHKIIPNVGLNQQFCTLYNVLNTCFNFVSQTVILFFFIVS